MAGEGPGDSGVVILNRECSILRDPRGPVICLWPGRYEVDYLRSMIGNRAFSDLIGIGDLRQE